MKPSRDPCNKVGRFILEECAAHKVTYDYACVNKIRRKSFREQVIDILLSGEGWEPNDPK
jgi:hypothetical protein